MTLHQHSPSRPEALLTVPHLDEAIALLRSLSGPHGIHASQASMANFRAIVSRDGVMAGVAGLLLRDERVSDGLARTLEGLRDTQGAVGQIASNVERRDNEPPHVSFGSLAPRIDGATLTHSHLHGFRNRPYEYHNGGIWTIWLGWLALALAHTGRAPVLAKLRELAAAQLTVTPTYGFQEYFHGATGHALGTPHMAYSATGIVFLELASQSETRALFAS